MIIKDKNKLKSKAKNKILVLGFILLIVGVGFFGSAGKADAQAPSPATVNAIANPAIIAPAVGTAKWYFEYKTSIYGISSDNKISGPFDTEEICKNQTVGGGLASATLIRPCFQYTTTNTTPTPAPTPPAPQSEFEAKITEASCMSGTSVNPFSAGCIQKVFYWLFHDIPAFLLYVSAYFFNVLLSVSLSTDLFRSPFVVQAWGIVRDLSNIFFILILLYIAIKIILGLGGSDVKK